MSKVSAAEDTKVGAGKQRQSRIGTAAAGGRRLLDQFQGCRESPEVKGTASQKKAPRPLDHLNTFLAPLVNAILTKPLRFLQVATHDVNQPSSRRQRECVLPVAGPP